MNKKILPYIFLTFLLMILIFISGVKYGKKVEQVNKTISYLSKISPTPPISPVTQKNLTYQTFTHKDCGLQFVIPSPFEMSFSCMPNSTYEVAQRPPGQDKIATEEIKLKNQKITAQLINQKDKTLMSFTLKNSINGKKIIVEIDKNLYPLFESTLQFLQ